MFVFVSMIIDIRSIVGIGNTYTHVHNVLHDVTPSFQSTLRFLREEGGARYRRVSSAVPDNTH